MDDLYFIPKCIEPKFEGGRMVGYSYAPVQGTSRYPSMNYKDVDYFKALKRVSKHEAEKIQEFLELKPYYIPVAKGWVSVACAPFEMSVQLWPKAPKIDTVQFLTHSIQFENNGKVFKRIDNAQVQENGGGIFKSYLYSILKLILDEPHKLIRDMILGQFWKFQFIRKIILNNCATIIIWDDGSKTVSKCLPFDTYDAEIGVLLCILKKFYKPSHLNKMFKGAMALKDKSEQIKKTNQPPICPYCKTHTMVLHYRVQFPRTCALSSEVFYECSKCHSRSPEKLTAREAKEAAMSIE